MTFLIAEIGINHLGDRVKLKRMIDKAVKVGLPSIKFQFRSGRDTFFHNNLEMGSTLISQELENANLEQCAILDACKQARKSKLSIGVSFFRTADLHDFCKDFTPDYIKIPSAEALNYDLIAAAQGHNVPVIVSTGGLTLSQLEALANNVQFNPDDCVMYCVVNYPTSLGTSFPSLISQYRALFDCRVGYSSHDADWEINIAYVYAGIDILERHLCERKTDIGLDISTSSDYGEMAQLNRFCTNKLWRRDTVLLEKVPNQGEIQNLKDLGSGYYYDRSYKAGSSISVSDLTVKSPCRGIRAGSIKDFCVVQDVAKDAPVLEDDLRRVQHTMTFDFNQLAAHRISLPIRFHDYAEIIRKFALRNFEFHMSHQDIDRIDELKSEFRQTLSPEHEFSIHLPDYISSTSLIDPLSPDAEIEKTSVEIIDTCVEFASFLEDFTSKPCPIVGSFSVIEGKTKPDFYNAYSELLNMILEKNGIMIVPQFLPKKAWYFGGSCELDAFCSLTDIEFFRQMPSGICLDTAHCIMAANYEHADTSEWIRSLLPIATHIHISDAIGDDGEGVTFGNGDLGRDVKKVLSHCAVKVVEQWEGHLKNFKGFEKALKYLEGYID